MKTAVRQVYNGGKNNVYVSLVKAKRGCAAMLSVKAEAEMCNALWRITDLRRISDAVSGVVSAVLWHCENAMP